MLRMGGDEMSWCRMAREKEGRASGLNGREGGGGGLLE
jgi:hypothetical protein